MKHYEGYEIQVFVSDFNQYHKQEIRESIEDLLENTTDKSYFDDEQGVDVLSIMGYYYPPLNDNIKPMLDYIAQNSFKSNGKSCNIEIKTVRIKDIPYQMHYYAEPEYAKLVKN